MHACPDCGVEHTGPVEPAAAAPVVVEADPGPNENDVKIAEVEAAARVELAELDAAARNVELEAELARVRGELAGVRETLATLQAPPPEPEPVVIPAPAPPEPEPVTPPPPPVDDGPKHRESGGGGWFAGYPSRR